MVRLLIFDASRLLAGIVLTVTALTASVSVPAADKGKEVYQKNCLACHQMGGVGLAPAFPPLKESELVNGADSEVIKLLLQGKAGTAMVSFAYLSDADIAAVLSYIRTSWGNTGAAVTAEQIQSLR